VSAITQKRWIAEVYPDLATAKNVSGFEWTHAWRFQSPPASVWELTENGKVTGLPGCIETTAENAHLIAAAPSLYEYAKSRALSGDDEARKMLDSLKLSE
jgi:hypothetical protein